MTEKLVPPLDSDDGWAFVVKEDAAIVIASFCHKPSLIVPVCPFNVAWQFVKLTVPKSASGRTPDIEDGASAIHCARDTVLHGLIEQNPKLTVRKFARYTLPKIIEEILKDHKTA